MKSYVFPCVSAAQLGKSGAGTAAANGQLLQMFAFSSSCFIFITEKMLFELSLSKEICVFSK